ncbi:PTS system mannose/fructose/sorbose family transporter subunit IID, partial [Salmonella enterica subsp. enterica serovar Lubbock]|nr:PTS system mannose/fructose/sorbose family transporter subunit IID [Salmonella enterica subsp. enterica serovar Lubbock]
MVDMTKTTTEKKLTPSDIRGVFLRSNLFQGSWNFERMQALGFCFSMVPAIRRLYPENNDARKQAIKRHLEFFNTHPYVAAPVLGVTLAMEEKRANGAEIDDGIQDASVAIENRILEIAPRRARDAQADGLSLPAQHHYLYISR